MFPPATARAAKARIQPARQSVSHPQASRYGIKPRLTLLILDGLDWDTFADESADGKPHLANGCTLVVPAKVAQRPFDADSAVADVLARFFASCSVVAKAAA